MRSRKVIVLDSSDQKTKQEARSNRHRYRHRSAFVRTDPSTDPSARAHQPFRGIFTMLDAFEIVTTSGVVLWRKHYTPLQSNVINSLINDVFIEERQTSGIRDGTANAQYKKDKYTLRYGTAKEVGLMFVVGKRQGHLKSTAGTDRPDRQSTSRCYISPGWIIS